LRCARFCSQQTFNSLPNKVGSFLFGKFPFIAKHFNLMKKPPFIAKPFNLMKKAPFIAKPFYFVVK